MSQLKTLIPPQAYEHGPLILFILLAFTIVVILLDYLRMCRKVTNIEMWSADVAAEINRLSKQLHKLQSQLLYFDDRQ